MQVIEKVEQTQLKPLVSIIIVTYNNLSYTRECLASIELYSDYNPLEVILVDNNSKDDTVNYLKNFKGNLDLKIIFNKNNHGFSAANNQGIRASKGKYIVLLNNDTFVTPGWVSGLLKHLSHDASIGIVGPITNNIGNEAKIDISYSNMEQMITKAKKYTNDHIGQFFPIHNLAFFCVMFHRNIYKLIGKLDERYGIGFFEDDDYCRRIEKAGYRIVCAEDVFIHHELSASFGKMPTKEKQKLFNKNKRIYESKWGKWKPHTSRKDQNLNINYFIDHQSLFGFCNICGENTHFYYKDKALYRESLTCMKCLSTSRYRSIARGILKFLKDSIKINARSLSELSNNNVYDSISIYDTQIPFKYLSCAYPIPSVLQEKRWINLSLSKFDQKLKLGKKLTSNVSIQNLEQLRFKDSSFDLVITSDVMEHVRLDYLAHREIHRVLKMGGYYIFTVPHDFSMEDSLTRVDIIEPNDATKDDFILEPEYHGDVNADQNKGALSYRVYGKSLIKELNRIGFKVDYLNNDILINGIKNTELFYCKKIR